MILFRKYACGVYQLQVMVDDSLICECETEAEVSCVGCGYCPGCVIYVSILTRLAERVLHRDVTNELQSVLHISHFPIHT